MITKKDVEHLAQLARIELKENEAEVLVTEIDSILGYVGQIKDINGNLEKVIPKLRNVMREDIPTNEPGQYREKLLDNTPSREGDYLKVKKIL